MKTRVLLLSNHFITLYYFRRELIERLLSEGYDVLLSLPPSKKNAFFVSLGCKIIETPMERRGINPLKDILLLFRYFRIFAEERPSVVYSYTIKPNIYGSVAAKLMRIPIVCNVTGTGATFLKKDILSSIVTQMYRVSVRCAECVLFQNSGDRTFFQKNDMVFRNDKIIPGSGVNLKEFPVMPFPDVADKIKFLYAGRIMEIKGIDQLIDAAHMLKEKGAIFQITLAGFVEEERYVDVLINDNELNEIRYIGYQEDMKSVIAESHCIILPSHGGEGVPNVLLEAASSARPLITSNIDGSRDIVDEGLNGYLFTAKDAAQLAARMQDFIELPHEQKRQMGIFARQKVEESYNREIVITMYIELTEEILFSNSTV